MLRPLPLLLHGRDSFSIGFLSLATTMAPKRRRKQFGLARSLDDAIIKLGSSFDTRHIFQTHYCRKAKLLPEGKQNDKDPQEVK